jgi:hypothetical protein
MPCAEPHQTLEDLVDLADPEDRERLKDPLQQYLQQHQQQETPMTGLWETFPKYLTEIEKMPESSLTTYWDTSERTPESQASIHQYKSIHRAHPHTRTTSSNMDQRHRDLDRFSTPSRQ